MTSEVVQNVEQTVAQTLPNAPVVEVAEAVASTVAAPTNPVVLVDDLLLVHKLATDLKVALAGKHPSLWDLVQFLFHNGS